MRSSSAADLECVDVAGIGMADLDQLIVGLGPGPFTGLRVGVVTARVLGFSLGLELRESRVSTSWPHNSLQQAVESSSSPRTPGVVRCIGRDTARTAYDSSQPRVSRPSDVPALPVIGPAADLYADQLQAAPGPRALDPAVLATAGATLPDAGSEPLYLRHPDATELTRPKSVLHYQSTTR